MQFPSDEEYLEFLETLDANTLRLTRGNCGMFAFALYDVFKTGTIVSIGNFAHILLEHNGKLYDGVKIYNSRDELKYDHHWGIYFCRSVEELKPTDYIYQEIVKRTCNSKPKKYFATIIKEHFNKL